MPDPTALLVIDEADRLKETELEQVRNIFDHGGIGLVLIGMPGIEKRLARYPQFYSRIGFVHEFRPLGAKENSQSREVLDQRWTPLGVHLPQHPLDPETVAAIIRITGGTWSHYFAKNTMFGDLQLPGSHFFIDAEPGEASTQSAAQDL